MRIQALDYLKWEQQEETRDEEMELNLPEGERVREVKQGSGEQRRGGV